jgi:SAM-dependent methyltransferase
VAGRRILDAGCGSGPLFAALRDRGAMVTGLDKSAGMLELARRRLGDDADLRVADLGRPLVRPGADYFATHQYSVENTTTSGQSYTLTLWHRPLPAMISAFTTAGFRIAAIDEPLPAPGTPRELLPDSLKDKPPGSGFLCFMFFVLEAG